MIRFFFATMIFSTTLPSVAEDTKPVSFMHDVAPILVRSCIACHNTRKAESKYNMITFAQLAKGGQQGEDLTLEPGKPEESRFVELLNHDAKPRMPYKQDPLPLDQIKLIKRWVTEGAKYDGSDPKEDWPALYHKLAPIVVPEVYPIAVPITALAFSPDGSSVVSGGYHELIAWKTADGSIGRRMAGALRAGL